MEKQRHSGAQFPIWSQGALAELIGNNISLQKRLLSKFIGKGDDEVATIAASIESKDQDKVEMLAHTMTSASRSVDAMVLDETCQKMEGAKEKISEHLATQA